MIIPEGYAQINHFIGGSAFPRGAQITYGVHQESASTPGAVALQCHNAFRDRWIAAMPVSSTLLFTRCKFGPNETGPFADAGVAVAGTYNTPADSPQVALLVKKVTFRGGRKGAGRMFMPVVPEASTANGGTVDPAQLTALNSIATGWLLDVVGLAAVQTMVLLHADAGDTPDIVQGLTVMPTLATQRRRLRKVGGRRRTTP